MNQTRNRTWACYLCKEEHSLDVTSRLLEVEKEKRPVKHRRWEEFSSLCSSCINILSGLIQSGEGKGEDVCDLCHREWDDLRKLQGDVVEGQLDTIGELCPFCIGHLIGIMHGHAHWGLDEYSFPVSEHGSGDSEAIFEGMTDIDQDNLREDEAYVYIIEANAGELKIGRSKNPQSRVGDLQIGSPHELTLLAAVKTDRPNEVEQTLQWEFSDHSLCGEWFKLARRQREDLLDRLDELCSSEVQIEIEDTGSGVSG